jgi:hypothetical protein
MLLLPVARLHCHYWWPTGWLAGLESGISILNQLPQVTCHRGVVFAMSVTVTR